MTAPTPFRAVVPIGVEKRKCPTHGEYESEGANVIGRPTWTTCPKCDKEAEDKQTREVAHKKLLARMDKAGIVKRFAEKSFANFNCENQGQRTALMIAKAYATEFALQVADGRCLVMVGNAGNGKTHLAVAILKEIMAQGFTGKYTTVYEAIEAIRETWRPGAAESEGAVVKRMAEVDLLILDEVGVQYGKESEQIELFKILNRRYNAVLPTVVISNVTGDDLKRYLGERVYDRLRENDGKVIPFDWESERGK